MPNLSYILCRPQGGLNDSLVQIEKCCRYAERNRRVVVVDTNYWCSRFFRDKFSNYFVSRQPSLILNYDDAPDDLNSLTVFPPSLTGKLNDYNPKKALIDNEKGRFKLYLDETGMPLALNTNKKFSERVLLDHALGGGAMSLAALSRLKLHPDLISRLIKLVDSIPGPYTSIHIRNTDYQTSYKEKLHELSGKYPAPYFVGTDSGQTLEDCREILGHANVFNFSRHLSSDETPMHRDRPREHAREINSDASLDLVMLALAKNYVYMNLEQNKNRVAASGFSKLANALHNNRPILNQLLGSDDPALSQLIWPT